MSVRIREARAGERPSVLASIVTSFGGTPRPAEEVERFFSLFEPERVLVADDAGAFAGGSAAFSFRMSVPGGELGCAGVTIVSVRPGHRRRGVLRGMMRRLLDQAHERGEPLAALFSSEGPIYGRFGFGQVDALAIEAERGRIVFRDPPPAEVSVRLLEPAEALDALPPLYERARAQRPGMLARTRAWWEHHRLDDGERARRGAFDRHVLRGRVEVGEALGVSPAATREIWRHLFSLDLVETVQCHLLPVDHPLPLLVTEPARLRMDVADAPWLRLVDVEAALRARSYAAGEEVVLEVRDPVCPWNEGRYRLPGGERTQAPADLRLEAEALGSAYLGGLTTPSRLAEAARCEELCPGALARADALLAVPRAPWSPEVF